jgi:hypothetical protein
MKALTLTQPWATLVVLRAKHIETRSWRTPYRGVLAIHAAKTFPGWAKDLCYGDPFRSALGWKQPPGMMSQQWLDQIARNLKELPTGAVIGFATVEGCREIIHSVYPTPTKGHYLVGEDRIIPPQSPELEFGDYSPGRWAWLLKDAMQLETPVPAKGALGLWEWEPATGTAVTGAAPNKKLSPGGPNE